MCRIECVQTLVDAAERRRRIGQVYKLLWEIGRRKETADDSNPGREAPSAASTSDASRCQHQFTPELARAQVAKG